MKKTQEQLENEYLKASCDCPMCGGNGTIESDHIESADINIAFANVKCSECNFSAVEEYKLVHVEIDQDAMEYYLNEQRNS